MVSEATSPRNRPAPARDRRGPPAAAKAIGERDQQAGKGQQNRKENHHVAAIGTANHGGDKQAGEHRHERRGGDRLPASPSEIPKSCAIGVSRLTGKNSTVIRQATQKATAKTADQFGRAVRCACGLASFEGVMSYLQEMAESCAV
jgi:hypothetical protein